MTPISTNEAVNKAISGLSISTPDCNSENTDTFTVTLYVDHGSLSV